MGWNSWNTFKMDFDQSTIEDMADLLVSTGLRDAGYTVLTMDGGWQALERASDGRQQANATKLPGGVKVVADYVHSRGLQLGIYSDAGIYDCGFSPGSWGSEELDAATYAEWTVDYLKYDNCGGFAANVESPQVRFSVMRDALLNSGRDIFYSLCQWGHQFPWYWADQIGQSYRMSGDITAVFGDSGKDCACKTAYCLNTGYAGCSVLTIIRKMREISAFQKPGSWADMDMLEIGNGNMTLHEQQTHQSFWAALKSPLIIGADLRSLPEESLEVLKNSEIIKISQDSLGTAVNYHESTHTGYLSYALIALLPGALSSVFDIPSAFGPVYPLSPDAPDATPFLKARPSDFVHPGLWHTHDDLERIRTNVEARNEPWASTFDAFRADSFSQANYTMQGPHAVLSRGATSNYSSFTADARAAWQNALVWYVTRDAGHLATTTAILDGWGTNLGAIVGIDRSLLVGLEGDLLANAAEIARWEGGWREAGASWRGGSGFSIALYWLFSRQSVGVGQANYGMASIKALLGFAVFLDDVVLWNYAVNEFVRNPCAGLPAMYEPTTGQSVEAGRDQGHTQSGIAWTAYGARVARSQGVDLYSLGDNLLLKAAEYAAAFNLNQTVPYDPSWYRCEAVLVDGPWANISTESFGVRSALPAWNVIYYEYVKRRGLDGPWTTRARGTDGYFEGRVTGADHPSWGDLIWA
ncbi:hypothetical protein V500_04511 [Neofusicoccum parvum]|uniref:Uncharacterized protein n=1 Tax=Neofusicoccum parvum TaxID=310453 RepID=A0ACB5RWN6_9PEZI|nr:hypothetical protein V500_04511 [Neofusicoccum parvum]